MKLKADRATLLKALAHIQSVAEKRNTIPILANVLIQVRDGRLSFTATDMEIAIVEEVAASTSRNGSTTAPAATLYDIVRKLPESAEIELETTGGDGQLALRAGRFATSLVTLPVEDFPSMTAGQLPHHFHLPALVLRGLIDRTRFAISTEETRYYLNGIYLHATVTEGSRMLRAAATDGHRLARVEEPLPEGAETMPGVIVPRKTVAELRKLLDEESGSIEVGLSDTRIQFRVGPIILTSKLIDGTFPDYERVIPRDNDKILRVGKKDFSDAVARVAAISSERSRPVKLSLQRDLLTLSAASAEQGSATEELDGDRVKYEAGHGAYYCA
jgi:DNA polymerase-3 subunit beta